MTDQRVMVEPRVITDPCVTTDLRVMTDPRVMADPGVVDQNQKANLLTENQLLLSEKSSNRCPI